MINFTDIKQLITARQAAESYGIAVNARGLALCPFHDDRTPSLKLDKTFYCFGCHARGDAIDFTARYFGISLPAAAQKLAKDFSIDPQECDCISPAPKSKAQMDFELWCHTALETLRKYNQLLYEWKFLAPDSPGEDFHFLCAEAFRNQARVRDMLCTLAFGTEDEKQDLYRQCREEVNQIHERIQAYERGAGPQEAQTQ